MEQHSRRLRCAFRSGRRRDGYAPGFTRRSWTGALKEDEAQRLKALEAENARLTRIVAEQALDISMLKEL